PQPYFVVPMRFARRNWRARIETAKEARQMSFDAGFARRNWRARIETIPHLTSQQRNTDSPAVIGGRGLER
ncbi:hypothetical protein, partial [Candidatus Competibacter phosphatis]|uniref:hypothetical protein n=1 Tax=Candidatus Competibacter phosphatis TaxID=221280 RepID=UPI003B9692F8